MFEIFGIEKRATDFDSRYFYSKNFKHLPHALEYIFFYCHCFCPLCQFWTRTSWPSRYAQSTGQIKIHSTTGQFGSKQVEVIGQNMVKQSVRNSWRNSSCPPERIQYVRILQWIPCDCLTMFCPLTSACYLQCNNLKSDHLLSLKHFALETF